MPDHKDGGASTKKSPPSHASTTTAVRLPIIAPKDDQSSSASSPRSGGGGPVHLGPSIPPRSRLPPRSRTGCGTCRMRKVKCDEGRPVCGQCTRLGHNCDYSPRLSFRDDTPRVVERMQEVSIVGGSIWDSNHASSPAATETSNDSTSAPVHPADDLPPFAQLLTDEDRERKAGCSSPGTYHVVINPDSFSHLPEYSAESNDTAAAAATAAAAVEEGGAPEPSDPNTVVLLRFEDVTRRAGAGRDTKSPLSPTLTRIKTEEVEEKEDVWVGSESIAHESVPPKNEPSHRSHEDDKYIKQFRTVVWKRLVPAEVDQADEMEESSAIIIENEAASFPPLYHAMMAVAALSMVKDDEQEWIDALGHYQQALPALQNSLKSAEDLSSDGAFLTHFLLLVYEIAAAEAGHSNLWSQHLSTLLRISLLRREIFGGERYPFIVWWICMIDLDALFTGAGSGEYVGTMLDADMIPPPSFHLYPLGSDGSSVVYREEVDSLPTVLQLSFEVTVLAVRLGLLANEFRKDMRFGKQGSQQRDRDTRIRQSRIFELQEQLRQLWASPSVMILGQNTEHLPSRSKRLFEQTATLYRACIIYSHTSMWPTQRVDTTPEYDTEIAVASTQILSIATRILNSISSNSNSNSISNSISDRVSSVSISNNSTNITNTNPGEGQDQAPANSRTDCRFLIFPVFMAGYAATDGGPKATALDLIEKMESHSIGRNTSATKKVLKMLYDKQLERFMNTGQSLDVDWIDVVREQQMLIVNFGL